MSLIASALSIFGISFVIRTASVFRARALVPDVWLQAIITGALACFSLMLYFAPLTLGARALFGASIAALTPLALRGLERRKLAACKARVPLFLDQWILNLRLGAPVTAAREAALLEEDAEVRALLRPVFDAFTDDPRPHALLPAAVVRELVQVGRAAHSALDRLEELRRGLRQASEFRRKSGQAVRQAAIQSVVMVIMLVALSAFTVRRYGWGPSAFFVTIAAAWSFTGALVMVRLSRKTKWTL